LYAENVSAFDDATLSTLEELVATTAHAISGLHAKETLLTDSVTEIDLRIPASNAPLLRMARAVEGDLTVEETVRQSDGRTLLYVTVRNATRDIDVIETVSAVERVSLVSDGEGESLVEVHVSGPTVPTSLTDHGGAVHELDVDDSKIHARLGLTHDVDVREFVETLEQTYPGTELLARRRCERSVETQSDFSGRVEEALTDRQLEALHTAYLAGYFAWPRESSGQEVATSLGIAQSTFTRHLRVSEQKLLSLLFD
jgi:predicted DNA binding protein